MASIIRISDWPADAMVSLLRESEAEGFRFLRRLHDDWMSGTNRFAGPGEALFGVLAEDRLLAVGGINRAAPDCGRLRRFYVIHAARRRGVGRHILQFAASHYSRVVLRTDTDQAARFYLALGFTPLTHDPQVTHEYIF